MTGGLSAEGLGAGTPRADGPGDTLPTLDDLAPILLQVLDEDEAMGAFQVLTTGGYRIVSEAALAALEQERASAMEHLREFNHVEGEPLDEVAAVAASAYGFAKHSQAAAEARAVAAERERDEARDGWDCEQARAVAAERERDELRLRAAEPCAECGHIDWREDLDSARTPMFPDAEQLRVERDEARRAAREEHGERLRQTQKRAAAEARAVAAERERDALQRERAEYGPYFARDMARIVGLADDAEMDAIAKRIEEAVAAEREREALACDWGESLSNAGKTLMRAEEAERVAATLADALDGLVWSLDGVWAVCSGSPPDSTHPFHPAFDRARAALEAYRAREDAP